jgi:hypothetical protein
MALFNPSRDEVRAYFFTAWKKFNAQQVLTDLEKLAVSTTLLHPEYHAILNQPDKYAQQEYFPEMGETNPFLHMSLHVSIQEQLSIDQPIGIVKVFNQLKIKHQDEHAALHDLIECLAETIWLAQKNQTPLDAAHYLTLMQQKAGIIA